MTWEGNGRKQKMTDREDIIASIVNTSPNKVLYGRIRIQKTVYLLDQLGLNSGFKYRYYHYGPFSSDIENSISDAKAFKRVEERFEYRQGDKARYSVFALGSDTPHLKEFGELDNKKVQKLVTKFSGVNSTILELAATANWLVEHEKVSDWEVEITRRKTWKTENGNLEKAISLLKEINLKPGI